MADNQRQIEREERKEQKKQKRWTVIWCVVGVVMLVLIVMKVMEIDFQSLKSDIEAMFSSEEVEVEDYQYTLDNTDNVTLTTIGSKILVLNSSSITVLENDEGEAVFTADHGFSNPVLSVKGSYSVLIDQGSNKYRVDSASGNVYTSTVDDSILCADVSSSGTVALVLNSDDENSLIKIYTKSLNEKFSYSVSGGYVTAIAVNDTARKIAFATVTSENARLKTTVYTMGINDDEPKAEFSYTDATVLDLQFSSGNIYVVGTNFVSVISSMTEETVVFEAESIEVADYCYNSSDKLILAYSNYSGESTNEVAYINTNGDIKTTITTDGTVNDVTASSSEITVLTDANIFKYSAKDGELIGTATVDDSYTNIVAVSSDIFAKHRSYVEGVVDWE